MKKILLTALIATPSFASLIEFMPGEILTADALNNNFKAVEAASTNSTVELGDLTALVGACDIENPAARTFTFYDENFNPKPMTLTVNSGEDGDLVYDYNSLLDAPEKPAYSFQYNGQTYGLPSPKIRIMGSYFETHSALLFVKLSDHSVGQIDTSMHLLRSVENLSRDEIAKRLAVKIASCVQ